MASGAYVSYLRVSTQKQGRNGLGIDGQRKAVADYLNGGDWSLIGEHVEVESGRNNARPELAKALEQCRMTGATLIIAKIDRLARNARFLLTVVEGSGAGGVVFCDLPQLPAGPVGKFMLTQMAAVAELEAGLIGQRTKAALQAAKARGRKLGGYREGAPKADTKLGVAALRKGADDFAARVGSRIVEARASGLSLQQIADQLSADRISTQRGGDWTATTVRNVLQRVAPEAKARSIIQGAVPPAHVQGAVAAPAAKNKAR